MNLISNISNKNIELFFISTYLVILGSYSGHLIVYNESLSLLYDIPAAHASYIIRIKEAYNGLVLTASNDTTIKLWDSNNNWNLVGTYRDHINTVSSLAYLNNDLMASGDFDGKIKLWRISSLTTIRTISSALVFSLVLLKNDYLASGHNSVIYLWNINNGSRVTALVGHVHNVNDIAVISDELLASCSSDLTVRIWSLTTFSIKHILYGHTMPIISLKVVTSDLISSGSQDQTIRIWNITDGTLVRNLTGQTSKIFYSLDLLDSETLISGSFNQKINTWQIETGNNLKTITIGINIYSLTVVQNSSIDF